MARIIIVSNRLPVSARIERGELVVSRGAGGVSSGLADIHERSDSVWIGWPGDTWRLPASKRAALGERLATLRCVPVELEAREARDYYEGFANGILWPVLHYQLDRLPTQPSGWDAYRRVNERFAEAVFQQYRPGDLVWIHDYQLMLVPGLLRRRLPDAAVGFFLHVPFPSSELFRVLHWRRELLEGILGATVVGFHTASYAGHFISSTSTILGCPTGDGKITFEGRRVRVVHLPMGIDAARYASLAQQPAVQGDVGRLRRSAGDAQLLVAVDRLDYTKGIAHRLLAFERCLETYPALRGRVRLIQVAAPSRESLGAYRDLRREVEELVGRINGRFATFGHVPIQYISRTLAPGRLVALYRAAAVALVTPLRDGMNLVAKEFVASRPDEDGVLVLSEFAGAAAELAGAILVNPYDLDDVAAAISRALEMAPEERSDRMRSLRRRVSEHDLRRWADDFLRLLAAEQRTQPRGAANDRRNGARPAAILAALPPPGAPLALILDYDGTLVPFRARPEDARPDEEIVRLLDTLASLPRVAVHIVSGRRRSELETWLGHLPIGLHAEHGASSRTANGDWRGRIDGQPPWIDAVRPALAARVRSVPGSHVEEKEASIVWHYRNADGEAGGRAADELRAELAETLESTGASAVPGARIVEVRAAALHKGLVVNDVQADADGARLLIVGDDTTDEDMFAAAPPDAITVKVGPGDTRARFRLAGPDQVRVMLGAIPSRYL
jgi:trehalose 6-phosphate synthase/phosphatase